MRIVGAIRRGLESIGVIRIPRVPTVAVESTGRVQEVVLGINSPEGRRAATQTTNLILSGFRQGKSSSSGGTKQIDKGVGFDSVLATQTTNLVTFLLDPEKYLRRLRARTEKKDK